MFIVKIVARFLLTLNFIKMWFLLKIRYHKTHNHLLFLFPSLSNGPDPWDPLTFGEYGKPMIRCDVEMIDHATLNLYGARSIKSIIPKCEYGIGQIQLIGLKLKSFKGFPTKEFVGRISICTDEPIDSLEGLPKKVKNLHYAGPLKSTKGCPTVVNDLLIMTTDHVDFEDLPCVVTDRMCISIDSLGPGSLFKLHECYWHESSQIADVHFFRMKQFKKYCDCATESGIVIASREFWSRLNIEAMSTESTKKLSTMLVSIEDPFEFQEKCIANGLEEFL